MYVHDVGDATCKSHVGDHNSCIGDTSYVEDKSHEGEKSYIGDCISYVVGNMSCVGNNMPYA